MPTDVDLDGDGRVSLYEAHIYTLKTAESADLSRCTSEVYLEKWEPWFLRWWSFIPSEGIYADVAAEVAKRHGLITKDGGVAIRRLYQRRKALQASLDKLKAEEKTLKKRLSGNQKKIRTGIELLWPEVRYPYTNGYLLFVRNDLPQVLRYIVERPEYKELVQDLDRQEKIKKELLSLRRKTTQLDKILRLRNLARLHYFFEKYATGQEKREYNALRRCENQPL